LAVVTLTACEPFKRGDLRYAIGGSAAHARVGEESYAPGSTVVQTWQTRF
jgi:hypothetical protein